MTAPPAPATPRPWLGVGALVWREVVRLLRQPTRMIGALGTVLLIWLVFANGFARALAPAGEMSYGGYLLPGMVAMVVLFASIFGAISLIEDRHEGFLQGVLVSPVSARGVLLAKWLGGALLAWAQGAVLVAISPLVGLEPSLGGALLALLAAMAIALGVSGLALSLAWRIDSVSGFHGIMNLVLMPLWLLSTAIFPISGAAGWLAGLMAANPMTWPVVAMRDALAGREADPWAWVGVGAVALVGLALAMAAPGRRG